MAPRTERGQNTQAGELWPEAWTLLRPSKGARIVNPEATQLTTDESFGDPGVRIAQFTSAFHNNVLGSICDPSYASTLGTVAAQDRPADRPALSEVALGGERVADSGIDRLDRKSAPEDVPLGEAHETVALLDVPGA